MFNLKLVIKWICKFILLIIFIHYSLPDINFLIFKLFYYPEKKIELFCSASNNKFLIFLIYIVSQSTLHLKKRNCKIKSKLQF